MSSEPKYIFAIHIIYGIILAISFGLSAEVFVPITQPQPNESVLVVNNSVYVPITQPQPNESVFLLVVNSSAILLVQYILISGWINYTLSINRLPHKLDNVFGNLRFVLDLIITFVIFYLVTLTDKDNFVRSFNEAFYWVIPILFLLFCIWDYAKSREYEMDLEQPDRESEINQMNKTRYALGIMVIQIIAFAIAYNHFGGSLEGKLTTYAIFIATTFGINTWYRIIKNDITSLRFGSKRDIPR